LDELCLFNQFLMSNSTLWIYNGDKLLFTSNRRGLQPLLEYIDKLVPFQSEIKIFDKIMGNAAALLSVKAGCKKVYSPLGSEFAIKTLRRYSVQYHIDSIIPYIPNHERKDMCPMEKLSIGKSPEEFYETARLSHYQTTERA